MMKKIMIVDDEHISLQMTEYILSTEYETVCASSGEEAVELYKKSTPDMVLSDLRMPGMDGYTLQQELERYAKRRVPFMFMTADHDDETESKGFENGAMDFIRKPFRADVLLRRIRNILDTVEKIEGLEKAADTDPMTGLLNKASSQKKIGELCRSTHGVLMIIDLDSFKLVNDLYGHDMGDKVLIRFAEIIQSAVRTKDLVGRIGGDEFIAFCQNISDESVIAKKAAYINDHLVASARELMGENMTIPLGASLGCVFAPAEGRDYETLYKKADQALYIVKQNGKHGFHFFREMPASELADLESASDLENTLKVFAERSPAKGAYMLPFEQFRILYRFFDRFISNYGREIWVLFFSLRKRSESEISAEDAAAQFGDVLRLSLRASDCITQTPANQFIVLLLETSPPYIDLVVERLMQNWAEAEASAGYTLDYECKTMKS